MPKVFLHSTDTFNNVHFRKLDKIMPGATGVKALLKDPTVKSLGRPWHLSQWPSEHRHSMQTH